METDDVFRVIAVFLAVFVIVYYSTLMERPYHQRLALLYTYPWWRLLVVLLVLAAAAWCPRVGVLVAFIVFLYLHDMNRLVMPLPELS
jgi:hypothetical protein